MDSGNFDIYEFLMHGGTAIYDHEFMGNYYFGIMFPAPIPPLMSHGGIRGTDQRTDIPEYKYGIFSNA